ncbi:MAG: hypothetical protein BIFFINMI_03551 [Phycisphaerae bacterium]|nr:hypothetical protein [Phycisphaerae bacterium]
MLTCMAMAAASTGCRRNLETWSGSQKYVNLHAAAFTAGGHGLLLVAPRRGDVNQPNSAAYYYLDLRTLAGRRLGYGQYALGEALPCPWSDEAAIPTYIEPADPAALGLRTGYDIYDLAAGRLERRILADDPALFVARPGQGERTLVPSAAPVQTQADGAAGSADLGAIWRRLTPRGPAPTPAQLAQAAAFRLAWVTRRSVLTPPLKQATRQGQRFYVLPSPDGQHELVLRFQAPGDDADRSADPDGDGYAYGYIEDTKTGRRTMLFDTTPTEQAIGDVGTGLLTGPQWLFEQPAKWFGK